MMSEEQIDQERLTGLSQESDITESETVEAAPVADLPVEPKHPDMKWYIVHTFSGYEQKAKLALMERVRAGKKEDLFGDILIPTESVVEISHGKKKTREKKFFPGYVFVNMVLDDQTWHIIRNTPRISGFVGKGKRPPSVPESEVLKLTQRITDGELSPRLIISFDKGEGVRVIDGPFQNFNGVVDDVNPDKGKLRVLVSIFGRSTPVELDYSQVEKS